MFGGQTKVPVVYLCRSGAPGNNAAQHSDNPYPLLINSPGLKVVTPADAYDMKGLLKTAIRDDDPVAVLATVRGASAMVPAEEYTIPLGQGAVKRVGSDVTVVAIMHLVAEALAAAEELEKEEISVEVVDPRTLVPLDRDMIFASVAKTGRLVIADDSPRSCGFAAEVAALVAEEIVDVLKAPIRRVTRLNVPIPFSTPMENMVLPNRQKIVAAVRETVSAARKGQTR
ncbi:MAG TPA: transketolase C-terminal domain-containing protein, partial [bacterium]|nr:transketolase C-terminal domain-containing protein [bacterium]